MQSSTMINRKHSLDISYFDEINTPEKAYWLGFIWADGNITRTSKKSSGVNRLRLAQKWTEKQHLEKFKQAIHADYEIRPVYHANDKTVAQLDINCCPLCHTLSVLGFDIKPKRTSLPPMNQKFISHFIRGYFDGDGCLSLYVQRIKKWNVNKQEFSITGNKIFIAEIKKILTEDAHVTPDVTIKHYKKSPSSASVRYGKISDIAKLYEYLYRNADVYLETKHQKFVEFFSRYAS